MRYGKIIVFFYFEILTNQIENIDGWCPCFSFIFEPFYSSSPALHGPMRYRSSFRIDVALQCALLCCNNYVHPIDAYMYLFFIADLNARRK